MRTRIIIAVISLGIGLFAGAKIMEHLGREYIVNNFPYRLEPWMTKMPI